MCMFAWAGPPEPIRNESHVFATRPELMARQLCAKKIKGMNQSEKGIMDAQSQCKMVSVQAEQIESVGFSDTSHTLFIKFRNAPGLSFEKVPRFRFEGLMAAPRKDAYFRTFIQNQFLSKPNGPA